MALIMILYITIFNVFLRILYNDDEFSLAALNFNYLVFFPILMIIIFGHFFLVLFIFVLGALILYGFILLCILIFVSLIAKNVY